MPLHVLAATAYLPPLPVFAALYKADVIVVDTNENYPAQTLRNRTHILSANGVQCLSIPVKKRTTPHTPTKDVRIDYSTSWQRIHWHGLVSAYGKSPFFMYYDYLLEPLYRKQTTFLIDFNLQLLSILINSIFKKNSHLVLSETYQHADENVVDLRYLCNVKSYATVPADENPISYYQVFAFRHGFTTGLSIADLLFNTGNEAEEYLLKYSGIIID